jgi:putative hydrolase of the HAD superfamily
VQRGVVFDGDDTLWDTEWLYDDARRRARDVVEAAGLDGPAWEEIERRIDVENVERHGHGVLRFPTSCAEAYEAVGAVAGQQVEPAIRQRIFDVASSVFERQAPLVPHARETLTELASRGIRLALLTKGDPEIQRRRIEQSGLASFFDLVEIVEQKTPEVIRDLIARLGVSADDALMVGNSVRSDVLPSLLAGVKPIWIDAHVWEYERQHEALPDEGVIELHDLTELLDLVEMSAA